MPTKALIVKVMVFHVQMNHVQMWELDHKEGWMPKNWCFQIVVQEKTLDSPLDSKEIQPVNPKGNQFWIFIGRTDAQAEASILQELPHWKRLGKIEAKNRMGRQRMRWLDSITDSDHKFDQTLGDSGGQRSLAWCSPWGCRVWHGLATEQQYICRTDLLCCITKTNATL